MPHFQKDIEKGVSLMGRVTKMLMKIGPLSDGLGVGFLKEQKTVELVG